VVSTLLTHVMEALMLQDKVILVEKIWSYSIIFIWITFFFIMILCQPNFSLVVSHYSWHATSTKRCQTLLF
jgi:hypothetical protein